jgi:hypothetical protein
MYIHYIHEHSCAENSARLPLGGGGGSGKLKKELNLNPMAEDVQDIGNT